MPAEEAAAAVSDHNTGDAPGQVKEPVSSFGRTHG